MKAILAILCAVALVYLADWYCATIRSSVPVVLFTVLAVILLGLVAFSSLFESQGDSK